MEASQNWRSFLNREEMTRDFPDVFSCFSFTSFCQELQLSNLQFFDGMGLDDVVKLLVKRPFYKAY